MHDFSNLSTDELCDKFSKCRISSYESTEQHFENLALIGSIAENLGIAEILLRNKVDSIMSALDTEWFYKVPKSVAKLKMPNDSNPSRDKVISMQSLGFWVKAAEYHKIESKIFSREFLDGVDFRRYYVSNTNHFKDGSTLRRYYKGNLLLHLLHNLRNRAFHFENLYKLNNDNRPRLSAYIAYKKPKFMINLESSKIQVFLDDFIDGLMK